MESCKTKKNFCKFSKRAPFSGGRLFFYLDFLYILIYFCFLVIFSQRILLRLKNKKQKKTKFRMNTAALFFFFYKFFQGGGFLRFFFSFP